MKDNEINYCPAEYEIYSDSSMENRKRSDRLQRRLETLESKYKGNTPEQQHTLDMLKALDFRYEMKSRIFKAGIEYYKARAEYCAAMSEHKYELAMKWYRDCLD